MPALWLCLPLRTAVVGAGTTTSSCPKIDSGEQVQRPSRGAAATAEAT